MSILQGTPISTAGIHPFVSIMANGQKGIDSAIAMAHQGNMQNNQIGAQYIRDAIQNQMDQQKMQLQREAQAQQQQQFEAQMGLQQQKMAQQERMQGQEMALRAQSAARQERYQSRVAGLQEMKFRREERMGALTEQLLSQAIGGVSNAGGTATGLPEAVAPSSEPSFDLTSVVSDQDVEGNPLPETPTAAPAVVSAQQPTPESLFQAATNKQILGLKIAAATNPSNAGYAIQKIGELEAQQAQAAIVASKGGPSGQVADIVNDHVTPGAGLIGGPVTPKTYQDWWQNATPGLRMAVNGPDALFDKMLTDGTVETEEGNIPVKKTSLYSIRDSLNKELSYKEKGAAEARFLATQEYKESGDQYVSEMIKANPYWSKIQQRRDRIDDLINADLKGIADKPSREGLATLSSAANTVKSDREYLNQMEQTLQRQWETTKKDGKYNKGLGESFSKIRGTEAKVGDWDMAALDPGKKPDARVAAFNEKLKEYKEYRRKAEVKEQNLKSSLNIMGQKGFEVDVDSIGRSVFGGMGESSEEEELNQRDLDDFREAQGKPRLVPSIMDDWNSR